MHGGHGALVGRRVRAEDAGFPFGAALFFLIQALHKRNRRRGIPLGFGHLFNCGNIGFFFAEYAYQRYDLHW